MVLDVGSISLNVTLANYRGADCLLRCVAVDLI